MKLYSIEKHNIHDGSELLCVSDNKADIIDVRDILINDSVQYNRKKPNFYIMVWENGYCIESYLDNEDGAESLNFE